MFSKMHKNKKCAKIVQIPSSSARMRECKCKICMLCYDIWKAGTGGGEMGTKERYVPDREQEGVDGTIRVSYKTCRAYATSNVEHSHPEYELYYLVTGEKPFYGDGNVYKLKSGDVMLIPAGVQHRSVWDSIGALSNRTVLMFDDVFIRPVLELDMEGNALQMLSGEPKLLSLSTEGRSQFELLMKSLNAELANDHVGYMCMSRMYVMQIIYCLLRNSVKGEFYRERRRAANMNAVMRYLDENCNSDITLNALADKYYMNASALARSFKAACGVTVINYVNLRRVEKAKSLMESHSLPVSVVAEMLGFKTTTYFERVFKQNTGMTPTEYKKRLKTAREER